MLSNVNSASRNPLMHMWRTQLLVTYWLTDSLLKSIMSRPMDWLTETGLTSLRLSAQLSPLRGNKGLPKLQSRGYINYIDAVKTQVSKVWRSSDGTNRAKYYPCHIYTANKAKTTTDTYCPISVLFPLPMTALEFSLAWIKIGMAL